MRIADFAHAIGCCRRNVYYIFKQKRIHKQQLQIISRVLQFDFVSRINEQKSSIKRYFVVVETDEEQFKEISLKYQVLYFRDV